MRLARDRNGRPGRGDSRARRARLPGRSGDIVTTGTAIALLPIEDLGMGGA